MHEFLKGRHHNLDNPSRKPFLEAKTLRANPVLGQLQSIYGRLLAGLFTGLVSLVLKNAK